MKKLWVVLSLVLNLAILFFFKYFDFAVSSINSIFSYLNLAPVQVSFDVILPVGISFYTFQALGYTLDVYRGEIKPEKNLGRYALFVSFFPQLVAGPIERSKNLLHQLREKHTFEDVYKRQSESFGVRTGGSAMNCVICGKPTGRNKYCCSMLCYSKFRQHYKVCPICGKVFPSPPTETVKTCGNPNCSKQYRSQLHSSGTYDASVGRWQTGKDKFWAEHTGEKHVNALSLIHI